MRADKMRETERNCEKRWFTLRFTQRHKRRTNRPSSWCRSRYFQHHVRCGAAFKWLTTADKWGSIWPWVCCWSGALLCRADEELTSSDTIGEREKHQGCHRPGDRHTMVFDRGVVTLSGENLRPGPGSGDRVGPGQLESPYGRVRLGRLALDSDTRSQAPFCTEKTRVYKYFQVLFPSFVSVM